MSRKHLLVVGSISFSFLVILLFYLFFQDGTWLKGMFSGPNSSDPGVGVDDADRLKTDLEATTCSDAYETAELIWSYENEEQLSSGIAQYEEWLIVPEFEGGTEVHFIKKNNGEISWSKDIGLSVESSPMVLPNGVVVVNTLRKGADLSDERDGFLLEELRGTLAFDIETQEILWGVPSEQGRDGSPGYGENLVLVSDVKDPDKENQTAYTYAIDPFTGEVKWSVEIPAWGFASPLYLEGMSIVGAEVPDGGDPTTGGFQGKGGTGLLLALDIETGAELWRLESGSPFGRSPIASEEKGENYIYAATQSGIFYKLRTDGTIVWETDTRAQGLGTPVLGPNNEYLYASVLNGASSERAPYIQSILSFDTVTGEVEWAFSLQNESTVPAVGDSAIYALSGSGDLVAISFEGNELWRVELGGHPHNGYPVLDECGVLYVTIENTLYAVQTESSGYLQSSSWPTYRRNVEATGYLDE